MLYDLSVLRGNKYSSLRLEALSEQMAVNSAKSLGYTIFSIKLVNNGWQKIFAKRDRFPLMLFSQEMLALLEAGLNLMEAIQALAEKEMRPDIRQTLEGVLRLLSEGQPLSTAMKSFPQAFPPLYVAALKASEKTGGMAESLKRYIAYQSQVDQVKKKIVSASIYPALLLSVGGLVVLFLLAYVVPKFAHIYEDMGSDLPFLSQVLLSLGTFIENHGASLLIGILIFISIITYLVSLKSVRAWLMEMVWC